MASAPPPPAGSEPGLFDNLSRSLDEFAITASVATSEIASQASAAGTEFANQASAAGSEISSQASAAGSQIESTFNSIFMSEQQPKEAQQQDPPQQDPQQDPPQQEDPPQQNPLQDPLQDPPPQQEPLQDPPPQQPEEKKDDSFDMDQIVSGAAGFFSSAAESFSNLLPDQEPTTVPEEPKEPQPTQSPPPQQESGSDLVGELFQQANVLVSSTVETIQGLVESPTRQEDRELFDTPIPPPRTHQKKDDENLANLL